jgi:hypothetical protein
MQQPQPPAQLRENALTGRPHEYITSVDPAQSSAAGEYDELFASSSQSTDPQHPELKILTHPRSESAPRFRVSSPSIHTSVQCSHSETLSMIPELQAVGKRSPAHRR